MSQRPLLARGHATMASGMHYALTPLKKLRPEGGPTNRPVVMLGGTAQTIQSLVGHAQHFSHTRDCLQYEARGQGLNTQLPLEVCDLDQHAQDFIDLTTTLRSSGVLPASRIDLVGFSFGARVCLAIAARAPELVGSVVLTGVPADRGAVGRTILRGWQSSLSAGNLEAFVWQSIVDGHSESFITRHESRLEGWVASAVRQNRVEAIQALVEQSHFDSEEHPQHSCVLARRVADLGLPVLTIGASLDRIAPPRQVERLSAIGQWPCSIVEGAGHSVLIEQPRIWRDLVTNFLDSH